MKIFLNELRLRGGLAAVPLTVKNPCRSSSGSAMAQDTSFLALYVLCNAISLVRMTICAVLPVQGKEIGTVNNKLNQLKYNKKRTVP